MTRIAGAVIAAALLLSACGRGGQVGAAVLPSISPPGDPITYVAVGASETAGVGADQPERDAWPQVFYRTALPRAAVLFNLGIPGATVADALRQEEPVAVDLHPDVVTVFLNVNDMLHRVQPSDYEAQLQRLLADLRGAGHTQVLVANVPPLDRLPSYLRCAPFAPASGGSCDTSLRLPPGALNALVDRYNAAIAEAASRTGGVVVDLHGAGLRVQGQESTYVSGDGFHPSTAGHRLIAQAFAEAYRRLSGG
jgi:lysophospholipase L1-like esterase